MSETRYLKAHQISAVQVGLTSKCNLMCSGCARVDASGTRLNQQLPLDDMSLETFKKLFNKEFVAHLERVEFCPVFGDPVASESLLGCIQELKVLKKDLRIEIHTNGSLRGESYWKNLAIELKSFASTEVRFSIDGIGEVQSYYRRNSSYDKILNNARSFIANGGNATWQFIEFNHNRHQIEEAREAALREGFSAFLLRQNGSRELTPEELNPLPHHKLKLKSLPLPPTVPELLQRMSSEEVSCAWRRRKMVYFCFTGDIWPCCFLANARFASDEDRFSYFQEKVVKKYPAGFNNIHSNTLEQILNSKWYQGDLVESWSNPMDHIENPLLLRCVQKCGQSRVSTPHVRTLF